MNFTKSLHKSAGFLQTPAGFIFSQLTWALWFFPVGYFMHFSANWLLVFSLFINIIAIVIASIILVSGARSEAGIQLKLDELILSMHGARNEVAMIEHDEDKLNEIKEDIKSKTQKQGYNNE